MKRLLQITLVAFIMTGLTTVAFAQADIAANANIQAQLTVTGQQDLNFGTVTPGNSSVIAVGDGANSGRYTLTGNGGQIDISFGFANGGNLVGPGNNIAIVFDNTSAAWGADASNPTNQFDPSGPGVTTSALSADPNNELWVFIGGTINVPAGQTAGSYSETITLTANYN